MKVYAGRDIYVRPSRRAAGLNGRGGERVATFPLNFPVDDKKYAYRICEDTFPEAKRALWRKLINHSLGQWTLATRSLVKMEHEVDPQGNSLPCADYSSPLQTAQDYLAANLRRPLLPAESDQLNQLIRQTDRWMDINQEDRRLNEIIMIDDTAGIYAGLRNAQVNSEVSASLGFANCIITPLVLGCALPRHGNITDILLRYALLQNDPLNVPGGDDQVDLEDVLFNDCAAPVPSAYETLLHEAGHVLGIRDGNINNDWVMSVIHHPTIPGSSMNYEGVNLRTPGALLRLPGEPDCAPHPFDIMAMFALYQTID